MGLAPCGSVAPKLVRRAHNGLLIMSLLLKNNCVETPSLNSENAAILVRQWPPDSEHTAPASGPLELSTRSRADERIGEHHGIRPAIRGADSARQQLSISRVSPCCVDPG
jgi:hypothetical protein